MVKNTNGGSSTKKFARKNFTKGSSSLRISENSLELYVQVSKILGGSSCRVIDLDKKELLCHIPGKFRGRNKRDNFISISSWLLVGLRDWESPKKDKLLNCDVIEVYSDTDKDKLKNSIIDINWNTFISNDNKMVGNSSTTDDSLDDGFVFADEKMQEYQELIKSQIDCTSSALSKVEEYEEEINIDDI